MDNRFFMSRMVHFNDGKVDVTDTRHYPFEAVFRFLCAVDDTIRKDSHLYLNRTNSYTIENESPEDAENTYQIIIHTLGSNSYKEETESQVKDFGYKDIAGINKYLEAMHQDARVVTKGHRTHVFFFQQLSEQSPILIKLAFSLRLLMPEMFEGDKPVFCDEFKKVMSFIDKDDWNRAWQEIEPYFTDLRRIQWLEDIKKMFANTYAQQIAIAERSVNDNYRRIESWTEEIRKIYCEIDSLEIKLRGMRQSNDTAKHYDEFISYLTDIGGEIIDYSNNDHITLRFKGFIDNYDPEIAGDVIPSLDGYLYEEINDENQDDLKLIYEKTFLENKYKIRVVSDIMINPSNYGFRFVNPVSGAGAAVELQGTCYLCNPHLRHHNCYGNNESDIVKALREYDYYSAAVFLNACNSNISFGDGVVMREMSVDIIKNRSKKMFFCPDDGKDYSMDEILEKEGNNNGTAENDSTAAE